MSFTLDASRVALLVQAMRALRQATVASLCRYAQCLTHAHPPNFRMLQQNFDATSSTDTTIFLTRSIGRHLKVDALASKF